MDVYGILRLELPIELESVKSLEIRFQAGDHVRCVLSGILGESEIQKCAELEPDSRIQVYAKEGEKETLLFSGIPVRVKLIRRDQLEVELESASDSIKLDFEKKCRSFQRQTMRYSDLLQEILEEYGGQALIQEQREDRIMAPKIQYEETDWEFINRLASCFGSRIYAWESGEHPQIQVGLREGELRESPEGSRELAKQVEEFLRFREKTGAMEQSYLTGVVRTLMPYGTGDVIPGGGADFLIAGKRIFLEQGRLRYEYQLLQKAGMEAMAQRNEKLKGAVIPGRILKVESNQVKLHLEIDKNQEEAEAFWYPCRRTDWYCMPEAGSRAALYFPDGDEGNGYVAGIYRTDGEENKKAGNPQEKYIGTQEGKELKVTPESVHIHASEKEVYLELIDQGGVRLKSSGGITLLSGKRFTGKGRTITMESGKRIHLSTRQTAIVMDERIQMKG